MAELFTKDGIVQGAGQPLAKDRLGLGLEDNHFYLLDGQLHTIHVCGDVNSTKSTGIYIPKEFSQIEYVGGRMASVVAVNPTSKKVIRASHVLIIKDIQFSTDKKKPAQLAKDKIEIENQLKINIQTTNSRRSRYIGDIGGPDGNIPTYLHSHITMFNSQLAMQTALGKKYSQSEYADYDSSMKKYLGDFRNFGKCCLLI